MEYVSNDLKQFDLLDRYWSLNGWEGDSLSVWVGRPDVLSGEHAGKRIEQALVTFRGVRFRETGTHDGQQQRSLTLEEAMERFSRRELFVFSCCITDGGCEFCGLGENDDPLFLIFDHDTVDVQWDAFEEEPPKPMVGELRKL